VGMELLEHRAVILNPEWYQLAHRASDALFELYQAIGGAHLAEPKKQGSEEIAVEPSCGCVFCDINASHPEGIACTKGHGQ
jgi:hypothetical protein